MTVQATPKFKHLPIQARAFGAPPGDKAAPAAAGADPVASFDAAYRRVMGTRDAAEGAQALKDLKAAYQGLAVVSPLHTERLKQAEARVSTLPYLTGPVAPAKPVVLRDPENSGHVSLRSQATLAKAYMLGYEGKTSRWPDLLTRVLPFLAKGEPTPAFERLPADQKAQFLRVAKAAGAPGQVALHDMLVAGRLAPALLAELDGLGADAPTPGIDRSALLTQALIELHDPTTISQETYGTCAPTSLQIMIALEKPALYVRLLRGLASPSGEAKLPGGTFRREPDWNSDTDGGRSLPGRLMQPAFMEFANGEQLDYQNSVDQDYDRTTQRVVSSGLGGPEAAALEVALGVREKPGDLRGLSYDPALPASIAEALDANMTTIEELAAFMQNGKGVDAKAQAQLMEALAAAKPQAPIYATVIYPLSNGPGFHAVLVTGVKDGHVSFINPWGREEQLSAETFSKVLLSANLPG